MAKKKQPKGEKVNSGYAQAFARQRRIKCISKEDGLTLLALLRGAGIRHHIRGNEQASMVTLEADRFVIDLEA